MNFEKWPANACVLGVEIVSWGGGGENVCSWGMSWNGGYALA